jgi:hypothetical protein
MSFGSYALISVVCNPKSKVLVQSTGICFASVDIAMQCCKMSISIYTFTSNMWEFYLFNILPVCQSCNLAGGSLVSHFPHGYRWWTSFSMLIGHLYVLLWFVQLVCLSFIWLSLSFCFIATTFTFLSLFCTPLLWLFY